MADCIIIMNGGGGVDSSELTAQKAHVLNGYTYVGNDTNDESGTGTMVNNGAVSKTLNAGEVYVIPTGFHDGSGKVTAANQVWTGWKQICKHENVAVNMDNEAEYSYDLGADFAKYNTFIFRVVETTGTSSGEKGTYVTQHTFICTQKADDTSKHTITPGRTSNSTDRYVYRDVEYSVFVGSDCRTCEVDLYYNGESETKTMYAWFEVVLIAALTL